MFLEFFFRGHKQREPDRSAWLSRVRCFGLRLFIRQAGRNLCFHQKHSMASLNCFHERDLNTLPFHAANFRYSSITVGVLSHCGLSKGMTTTSVVTTATTRARTHRTNDFVIELIDGLTYALFNFLPEAYVSYWTCRVITIGNPTERHW